MSQTFPSLKPTTRSFSAGVYPVKTYRALSGATVKRSFGNKPSASILRLGFVNITDDKTELILEHYYDTEGGFRRFAIPNTLLVGMDGADSESIGLRRLVKRTALYLWEYAGPPEVESVYRGISTVTVELRGELNLDRLL